MKIYKYEQPPNRDYYSTTVTVQYGYIGERVVDDYNGSIKVFIEIAAKDFMENVRSAYVSEYYLRTNKLSEGEWSHLSSLKLTEANKKEVQEIKDKLIEKHSDSKAETKALESILKDIEIPKKASKMKGLFK